ncbi:MAG: hypothetical protein HKP61_06675 [Dactylosporangium sp.]|nr:SRPBCC domain-containing protein [Dactylosporangium sp.]NNJ60628.1 hypothetical protein [Dactylosporangium sp.]
MTEIQIEVDLPHSLERVWRAVTDPRVLREWFLEVTCIDDTRGTFTLSPDGAEGLDDPIEGEIVEREAPHRLMMRWTSERQHTLVTVTLLSSGTGCALTLVQRGFIGQQGSLRRRVLHRTYTQMLNVNLRAALKRLEAADRERDNLSRRSDAQGQAGPRSASRNQARFFTAVPRQASMAWAGLKAAGRNVSRRSVSTTGRPSPKRQPARGIAAPAGEALSDSPTATIVRERWSSAKRARRAAQRRRTALAASAAIVVLLAALAVLIGRLTQPVAPGAATSPEGPQSIIVPGGLSASSGGGGAGAPTPLPATGASEQGELPVLSGTYLTTRTIVGGYEGVVLVNNLSTNAVNGWSVWIVLPPLGLVVHDVRGALAVQTDKEVRFVPVPGNRVVPAGESVRFTFQVQGVGAPVECVINDRLCAGIPE